MDTVLKDLALLAEGSDEPSLETYINEFLESVTKDEIAIPRHEVVQTLLPLKIKHIFYDFHKTFPHFFCLEVINGYSIAIIKTPFKGNAVIQNLISHANRFTQKLN